MGRHPQSTAGGGLIGEQIGGPLGAAIGAGAGFLAGLGEKLFGVESPENSVLSARLRT